MSRFSDFMEKDRFDQLLEAKKQADLELERMRSPITILFSDIKGSTSYFERKGDVEGLAMVQRHNNLLIPIIQSHGGRVIKTIGDAIMASFGDPTGSVQAAAGMQRALEQHNRGETESEQIHIRIGLHTGLGLLKDNDVYGDVVNAASRVQHEAQPDQILITDGLVASARVIGFEVARLRRTEVKGKSEPLDLYAVAWSESASKALLEELREQYEQKLKDAKKAQKQLENDLEDARDEWRKERRKLIDEVDRLEREAGSAKDSGRGRVSEDFVSEWKYRLQEATKSREQLEQELKRSGADWEAERTRLKTQINQMENRVLEAMERANNPIRAAQSVREQFHSRLEEAVKAKTQLEAELRVAKTQWETERKQLTSELEKLKKSPDVAKRLVLEKLKAKDPKQQQDLAAAKEKAEQELKDVQERLESERKELLDQIQKLEKQLPDTERSLRKQLTDELRAQIEPKLEEAQRARAKLEEELRTATSHLTAERDRLAGRIQQLEQSIPAAQEAIRRQAAAEARASLESQVEELQYARSKLERKVQDSSEEWDSERRRLVRKVEQLEESLSEAKDAVRNAPAGVADPAAIRAQIQMEFQNERNRMSAQIIQLEQQLADARKAQPAAGGGGASTAEMESLQNEFEREMEASKRQWEKERQTLQQKVAQLEKAAKSPSPMAASADALEAEMKLAEISGVKEELEEEIEQLKKELAEARGGLQSDASGIEAEMKVMELEGQNEQLKENLRAATAKWEKEKAKLAEQIARLQSGEGGPGAGPGFDPAVLDEIERVEGLVREINELIDNPATELSVIIRKNVERAEMENYLKGMRYAIGKANARK